MMYTAADDRGYDVWTLVSATLFLFSMRILLHPALARHGCSENCTHTYFSILAQAFSNEVSLLSKFYIDIHVFYFNGCLPVVSQFIVILTKKKMLLFKFLWLEFRFKSFFVLQCILTVLCVYA